MKNANEKIKYFLIVCLISVIFLNQCDAGKDKDKHKHKQTHNATTKQQQQHKNATASHHQNHTASHDAPGTNVSHDGNAPPIGWSLHNNPNQPPPAPNPHGYAAQHHIPGHPDHSPDQPHPGHQQQHSQPAPVAQAPDSGPSALGAGIGGLALGALGGAAGGYFLSNALNSGGKSGEEKETTVDGTTLTTLPLAVTEASAETTTASTITVASETSTETTTAQIVTVETVTTTSVQPSVEVIIKAEQKLAEPQATTSSETPTDKSSGEVRRLSLNVFMLSVVSSCLFLVRT